MKEAASRVSRPHNRCLWTQVLWFSNGRRSWSHCWRTPPEAAAPPAGTARILWPHLLLCVPSPLKFVAKPGQFYYGGGWWVCMLTFCSRRPCLSNQEADGFLCSKSHFFGGPFLAISLLGCRHSHKSIPGKCRESYILEEIWKCLKEHVCNGRIFPEALGRPHLWKKLPLLFLWGASV